MVESARVVDMVGIVKRFPGVLACDHVDFSLHRGEVHALLGENGAGKSTLMNILSGLYRPDEGSIFIEGRRVHLNSPRSAIACGLGMVHQHFMLVPPLTVTENIVLGLSGRHFRFAHAKFDQQVLELQERYSLRVDPRAKIWQLSVGEQQRVELLKMLYRGARVLIMDEPTAVLTPQEVDDLVVTLRAMATRGHSVIFISHKLDEVLNISDRITILRQGRVAASGLDTSSVTKQELAQLMVGHDVAFTVDKPLTKAGAVVLEVQDVWADNDRGLAALKGFSLQVHASEVVGIAAVAGNGQSELAQVVTGLRKCRSGQVLLHGTPITKDSPSARIGRGMAHVPEDRTGVGSAPNLSLAENLIMKRYRQAPYTSRSLLNYRVIEAQAAGLKDQYGIAAPSVSVPARLLSGGNLQKMILARELSGRPGLLVAMQPTRGLDVGAIETVHRLLLEQRAAGAAIMLVSEDLDEILALSDRVVVLYEGRSMGEVSGDQATCTQIGLMMAGTPHEGGADG
jgi:ABC-type uncharacterized transport system ATPase subunit